MSRVWSRIQHHSRELKIRDRYRNMHISMFCIRSRPNFKFPKLKGRAAEIKCLVHPLLLTWCEFMDSTSVVHKQIRLLLQCSARMEDLVYDRKKEYKFAPDAHADLMRNCENFLVLSSAVSNHFSGEGIKVFNIVPKHHFLWHCCFLAKYLSPRWSWCFSGEDYMQHMRRLGQSVLRGTPANMVSRKIAHKFVRGFTWRLSRCAPAP